MIAVSACAISMLAHADSWLSASQAGYGSEHRQYGLKVVPNTDTPPKPGHCHATLYHGATPVWSRHLINNCAPVRAFVADSGAYVVTMDEWHRVGQLPVVIYGARGELIRVHSLDSLGLRDDMHRIKHTVSSRWWNEDAICFFGPRDETFCIRLHWGEWLILELRSGDVFQFDKKFYSDDLRQAHAQSVRELEEYLPRMLARHTLRLLASENADERKTAALLAGQLQLRDVIPRLRELLADNATYTESAYAETGPRTKVVYFVRKAAKDALVAMGEDPGAVRDEYYPEALTRHSSRTGAKIVVTNTEEAMAEYMQHEYGTK